jgi:hypothetical protein
MDFPTMDFRLLGVWVLLPSMHPFDDITELADRVDVRGIAGLKAAATTALKRYANIFLWLARRRNIIVSSHLRSRLVVLFRYEIWL